MKLIFILFLTSLITFSPNLQTNLLLEEISSFGSEDDELFLRLGTITVDEEEMIYVTDMFDYSIKKISQDGKLLIKSGKKGGGPGEFQSQPVVIFYYNKKIYVTELFPTGINVFNANDLKFIKKIKFANELVPIYDFYISENKIFISNYQGHGYSIFDLDGRLLKKVNLPKKENQPEFDLSKILIDKQNNRFLLYVNSGILEKYDHQDRLLFAKKLKYTPDKIAYRRTNTGLVYSPDLLYKAISENGEGKIVILVGHNEDKKISSRSVLIFDLFGNEKKEFFLAKGAHTIYCYKNYLLAGHSEGTVLKKYLLNLSR